MTNVFVKDDSGFDITFTVDDSSGEDVSLASISSVILKMKKIGALSTTIFGACTVTSATIGQCTYSVQAGDFDTLGNYETELQLTYPANRIITAKLADIFITGDL